MALVVLASWGGALGHGFAPSQGVEETSSLGPAATNPAAQVIPFTVATAERSGDGRFTLAWSAPAAAGPVAVYALHRPSVLIEPLNGVAPIARGGSSASVVVADPSPGSPTWFELRPARGAPLVVGDRSLHLSSAPNFRDVGGYRTADGRWVRMGVLYRSDQLDRLSPADLAQIASLGAGLVVDLRTDAERKAGLDRLPPGANGMIADVLASDPPNPGAIFKAAGPAAGVAFMVTANRNFVTLPSAKTAYTALFSRIAVAQSPVVYHCSAGKDRTGWASAVLLTALGVPRDTVMADYLASNVYLQQKNRAMFATMTSDMASKLEPVFTVKREYLEAAFKEVEDRYGSFSAYLRAIGMDDEALDRLRARLLVGSPYP
jgi:protein-tyrosine phosphatase